MILTVKELKAKLDALEDFLLLDVRTDAELEIASIHYAVHIPLHDLQPTHPNLAGWQDKEIVCMCHHGGRSAQAQQFLLSSGYGNVKNLVGGIHAYAQEVDPSIPVYE